MNVLLSNSLSCTKWCKDYLLLDDAAAPRVLVTIQQQRLYWQMRKKDIYVCKHAYFCVAESRLSGYEWQVPFWILFGLDSSSLEICLWAVASSLRLDCWGAGLLKN